MKSTYDFEQRLLNSAPSPTCCTMIVMMDVWSIFGKITISPLEKNDNKQNQQQAKQQISKCINKSKRQKAKIKSNKTEHKNIKNDKHIWKP